MMSDPITLVQLQNASTDAQTLEEFVNGSDTTTVTARLGATYPSAAKIATDVGSSFNAQLNAQTADFIAAQNQNQADYVAAEATRTTEFATAQADLFAARDAVLAASLPQRKEQVFIEGTDFVAGATTLTTTFDYGSKQNIELTMGGLAQSSNSSIASYASKLITFNAPLPIGVGTVMVAGNAVGLVITPADGTVTDAKISPVTAMFNRIFDPINPHDPVYGAKGNTVVNGSNAFVSGNDDTAALQAAVNAAHTRGGGRVEITSTPAGGVYSLAGALQLYDNVELVGKGGIIYYRKPAFNYLHAVIAQGKNNTVKDLVISSDPALIRGDTGFAICANGATDALIQNNQLLNQAGAGIWVTASTNTRVLGNRVNNCKADGIHFSDGAVGFVASGNILNGTQDDAIAVVLDTIGAVQPQYGSVVGNLVNGTTRGHGVVFIGCVGLTIDSNTLMNIGAAAGIGNYQWNADARRATNVSITSNNISQTGLSSTVGGVNFGPGNALGNHGILLGWCSNTTVMGNTISDINDGVDVVSGAPYTSSGIFLFSVDGCFIKNNTIKNCVSHGIWVFDAAVGLLNNIVIDGNTFFNIVKYVIKASPTSNNITGLFITNNTWLGSSYDASVAACMLLGGTLTTNLRVYNNIPLDRETIPITITSAHASNVMQSGNLCPVNIV